MLLAERCYEREMKFKLQGQVARMWTAYVVRVGYS